jgi:CubicO group peptidase (beta-lactamase class C family)
MGDRVAHAEHTDSVVANNMAEAAQVHGFTTLCVLRGGQTVVAVGPQDSPLPVSSIRKSILSSLFGRLIAQGDVRLSTTLAELGLDDSPHLTDQERSATIHNLLTSSSGVYLPLQNGGSTYDILRNSPSEWPKRGSAAPGARFRYSNWDFNILGEIYQRVSGVALFTAIDKLIAQPLDFRDWNPLEHTRLRYAYDALGATPRYPNYSMQLSARDLARFGQLYLNGGRWGGNVIVPQQWIRESTRSHIWTGLPNPFQSYGYLWWTADGDDPGGLPHGSFSAVGLGGQILSVIPTHQTVIVAQRQNLDSRSTQMALPPDIVHAAIQR